MVWFLHRSPCRYSLALVSRRRKLSLVLKNIQTWPPFPERERSKTAGTFISRQAARNAAASFCQGLLIEIDRLEPARLVLQKRMDSDCMIPDKMTTPNVLVRGLSFLVWRSTFFTVLVHVDMIFQSRSAFGMYPDRPSAFSQRMA
jgi:hypothetical protein